MALVHKLLFTSFVIAAVRSNAACPVSCNCTTSDLRVSVNCKGQGLTAIPTELPKNTSTVDLRDNHVKCDCQFYEYWKTLKGEGVEIHGECSDLSDKLSGLPFQELNEDSFACDGSSVSNQKTAILGAESSTAAVNAPSRSSVSGENPSMVSQKADVPLATSSVAVPVTMSSQAVPVVTSSPTVLEVKPSQAPPEVMSSQPVPEVISSHAAPMVMRSSQAADVGALSRAVPVATSSQPLHAEVKLSHAAPVLTSSQAVPVVTSSPAVLKVAPSQAVPEVMSSQPVPEVTSSHAAAVVMSSQAILQMPSSRPAPVATSSQPLPAEVESSHATPVVTSSRAVPVATSSQPLPAEVESSHVAPVVTSFRAVPVATSSQPLLAEVESSHVAPVVTSSQAVLGKTSSQVVPVLTSSQALPVGTSSQAGLAITSSISAHVPDIAGLALSPSSTLAKPTLATTRSPSLFEISTSTALELADTSSSSGVTTTSSSVVTGPPMRSTGVEVNVTSVVNVSPTVSAILNGSVAAITPPTKQGSPIIVTFDAPNVVGLNTMIQVKCVATGNPPPKVYLTVNNEPANNVDGVTVTSGDAETEIEFKAVRTSEVYCEARNKLGRDKRKIRISVKQTGAKYMMLKVKLIDEEFKENMKNKDSKEFQDLAEKITSQVRSLVSSIPSFLGVSLVRLRPGSVNADILVKTFQDNGDLVEKTLKAEIDKAKLGNVPVDRYKYSFEQAQACPSEFENVTWNDAAYGEMDVQPCPRGAQGFARRNCSVGDWYYPDYTNCKSDNFVNLKNQINQSTSHDTKDDAERNILTGLQNLLNLTTPDEDHAVMAGDLAISAEILELVADYITRKNQDGAHSEREVKHVINVASNVLHLNNEQEFIVAQKLIQTASKFILVLEKYGLQAARVVSFEADKNLAIFITDNVVMGAGIANPESISKDVIFPNYKWPKLAGVQEKWNVTTFVVLGHEMIKAMKVDKSGIRIAGFLYRTLTRILSFESAYSDKGLAYEVNSAVISASMDPKPTYKLNDPVIIASRNLQEVDLDGDEPICAFWDFNMNAPHGGWSEEGCNTSSFNTMQTTCQCDHMTNFAVLRSKLLPPVKQVFVGPVRDFIHCIYIACWIIIAFAGITFLILLILSPWLEPDRTWAMHMCVCASVIVTFVLILLGLASYNDLDLCNLFSFLVHYFFLCAFSWILTESVYMRTWDTEKGPQKKYWIGYFLLGWGLPGIAMLITWLINKLSNFESYMSCWMSIFNPLIWVFFAPALIFFVVSFIFFVRIWRAITGLPRQGLKTYYKNTRFRVQIRYCLILMLMFMVTWLVGVLLITYYWKALLCILFIICCIVTGFMILLFYVIMDRQVRDAFRLCCCYCRRGRKGSYWVKGGDDVFKQSPQEEIEYRQQERQRLVSEGTEQQEQDQDIEMNGVDKTHEYEEPLLRQETRLQLEEARPLESSTESFDPLYERVRRSVTVDVQPGPSTEKDERPQVEPVYAQVVKPKRLRHPESDSDDDDEFLTPEEREARGIRGLTREQVIRMAKKSDASKKVLNQYESPAGSREELGQPVYLLNQQELDEELKQFRKFFAHDKTPVSSPPATSTPRSDEGSSTPSGTFKRETSTEVTRSQHSSFSSVKGQSSVVHESYKREESTSSSITKRALSGESQLSTTSVSRREESTVEKKVGSPAMLDEMAVDPSLQELDRTDDDKSDSPNKPTAV